MSINHFMNKIKGQSGIDSTTLLCLLVVVLVAVSSFGLGRLSVVDQSKVPEIKLENNSTDIVKEETGESLKNENYINTTLSSPKERMYVASKNGKLYYSVGCSGAKRIAAKNEIWFASSVEAEKAGYKASATCK